MPSRCTLFQVEAETCPIRVPATDERTFQPTTIGMRPLPTTTIQTPIADVRTPIELQGTGINSYLRPHGVPFPPR